MATPQVTPDTTLRIERTIAAPREKVFEAWTKAAALARWFAPSDEHTVTVHTLDLRPGGTYRIEMRHSSGRVSVARGVYREVAAPSRLVFTWSWEEAPEMADDTLVTVELTARGQATVLVLTHERFTGAPQRDEHNKGWTGCLDRLVQNVTPLVLVSLGPGTKGERRWRSRR